MAPGHAWDTYTPTNRQRWRPLFPSTPAPLGELDHNTFRSNVAAGPSTPWPLTPWNGPDRDSNGDSRPSPSSLSPPTTTSTIRYLRLAFQVTPPKLKELEEGWRIARRAASRPGPVERVVVVEPREPRSERKRERRGKPAIEEMAARREGRDEREAGAALDRKASGKGGGLLHPPRAEPPPSARTSKSVGKSRTIPPPDEHSVGQSTGLLTPPASPHPGDAKLKPKATKSPKPPVRFVSPPPTTTVMAMTSSGASSSTQPDDSPAPSAPPVRTLRPASPERPRPMSAPPVPLKTHPSKTRSVPLPILVHPLPLTSKPEPLSRRSTDTIMVHPPTDPVALTLALHRQVARVNRAGDAVTIESRTPQTLCLDDLPRWTQQQRDLWLLLARFVDEYKRRTARIKVFTQLGDLVVTCSEPPDIVLSFITVDDGATTKVRLRYSLSTHEAILDTSMRRPRGGKDETHRSRRAIPLRWEGDGERAALALGVSFADWDQVERDAVRRLWALREDWARFVPGYN